MKIRKREAAAAVLDLVFGVPQARPLVGQVHRIHSARLAAAIERYIVDFDRGLSLTDWSTLVVMKEQRIAHLATFDHAFRGLVDVVSGGI